MAHSKKDDKQLKRDKKRKSIQHESETVKDLTVLKDHSNDSMKKQKHKHSKPALEEKKEKEHKKHKKHKKHKTLSGDTDKESDTVIEKTKIHKEHKSEKKKKEGKESKRQSTKLSLREIFQKRWKKQESNKHVAPLPTQQPWGTIKLVDGQYTNMSHENLHPNAVERRETLTQKEKATLLQYRIIRENHPRAVNSFAQLESIGIVPRRGPINADESMRMLQILESLCLEYNLTPSDLREVMSQRTDATDRQYNGFWQQLQLACPDRPSVMIVRHLRYILDDELHTRDWTKEEKPNYYGRYCIISIYKYNGNWIKIAERMGIKRRVCYEHYRTLHIDRNLERGSWSLLEKRRLVATVLEHIKKNHGDIREFMRLRIKEAYASIRWQEISREFPRRDAWQCRNAWRSIIHTVYNNMEEFGRRMTAEEFNIHDDRRLLSLIYDSGIERDSEISWMSVARDMDFKYSGSILSKRFTQLKRSILNYKTKSLDEILDELIVLNNQAIQQYAKPVEHADNTSSD
ncbi:hypothetical protein BDF19DRAFT_430109 [Syncephalis fuscata]|nr:hypothetical protein BDF19DRAFT_430109 [Syncephalis fuscata]